MLHATCYMYSQKVVGTKFGIIKLIITLLPYSGELSREKTFMDRYEVMISLAEKTFVEC